MLYFQKGDIMKKLILGFLLTTSLFAKDSYYIELDPFAYTLDGYSLHLGKQADDLRLDLGIFALDVPKFAEENMYDSKDFDMKFNGFGLKLDYFINENIFIGLDGSYQDRAYTHHTTNTKVEKSVYYLGIRTGFEHEISTNLYFSPWIGMWKNLSANEKIIVSNSSVGTGEYDYFMTAHVGYRF